MFQYNDEDDVNSWYYSKYVVEQERQEHMARLREQGIELPEEVFYERSTANTGPNHNAISFKSVGCFDRSDLLSSQFHSCQFF